MGNRLEFFSFLIHSPPRVICLAIALRLIELLAMWPTSFIVDKRRTLIEEFSEGRTTDPIEAIAGPPMKRQRLDIECVFAVPSEAPPSPHAAALAMLAEIQASLGRWAKRPFTWFTVTAIAELPPIAYGCVNGTDVVLGANVLNFGDRTVRLSDISFAPSSFRSKKSVILMRNIVLENEC
jgi:hypothetical protein